MDLQKKKIVENLDSLCFNMVLSSIENEKYMQQTSFCCNTED